MLEEQAPVFQLPYNYRTRKYRLLWHQTLNDICRYPEIPRRSVNFDVYPLTTAKVFTQRTLSSTVTTRHIKTLEDAIVTEKWLADDLSMRAGFYYKLLRFFQVPLDSGDYLVWYPKDRVDRAFAIIPLKVFSGEEENQDINPIHEIIEKDYRWLRAEVNFQFKIARVFDVPDAATFIEGV